MIIFGLCVILTALLWWYFKQKWLFFEKRGLPYSQPTILGLGTTLYFFRDMFGYHKQCKEKFGPVYGIFTLLKPNIVCHDPNILAKVTVKHFPSFNYRMDMLRQANGKHINNALSNVMGDQWKRSRAAITPAFSTSKLKEMLTLMDDCGNRMVKRMDGDYLKNEKLPVKDVFGKYSLEVVLTTAFSVDLNKYNAADDNSDIFKYAKSLLTPTFNTFVKVLPMMFFPSLEKVAQKFNISVFDSEALNFFSMLCKQVINHHDVDPHSVNRTDLIQQMLNAKVSESEIGKIKKGLTDIEVIGNAMSLILAGYENTANTIGFLAYNLAMNQDIQRKVYNEIEDVLQNKKNIEYDDLKKMKYLDMCLNESLRLYSPILLNARTCTQKIAIDNITIEKGMVVLIPVFTMQRDPEFWENPDQFNPERMRDMTKINPMVFQPFGNGPRNCIAKRFALIEVKLAIVKILQKYIILPNENTPKPPLELINKATVQPATPIVLKLNKREH